MDTIVQMLSDKGIDVWATTVHAPAWVVIISVILGMLLTIVMVCVCFVICRANLADVVAAMRNKENKRQRRIAIEFVVFALCVSTIIGSTAIVNVLPKTVYRASMTDEQLAYAIRSGVKVEHKDGEPVNEYVIYGINNQEFYH